MPSHLSTQPTAPIPEKKEQEWQEYPIATNNADPDVNTVALAAQYVPGSQEERAFVRKIDKRIVPCIWGLYTLSYIDRANIG